ncbi:MAG: hypothetical protein K8R90_11955 [Candidatus Cloacimonetes bacterium]|nr:hypothetical protein [Candidatus Cloacimonadota bacterium]
METFEQHWRARLAAAVEATGRKDICLPATEEPDAVGWINGAMNRLHEQFSPDEAKRILTCCACRYPADELATFRRVYEETGSVDAVMASLQASFEKMMRERLGLDEEEIAQVRKLGIGPAGERNDNVIVSTKIPKSGWLKQWLHEPDPEVRRSIFCHCPQIREAIAQGRQIDPLYCYCAAGFYRYIWETVLEREVRVEMLASLLLGDDFCQIAVHLPPDA